MRLQRELGLPVAPDIPLVAFIGRLDYQKGPDLILDALPRIVNLGNSGTQVVLLGTGASDYEERVRTVETDFPYYARGRVGFDVPLSHRLLAAADILLMPSRFEPCGLNQMYAMRYGTVPVAHSTGGLRDTIDDVGAFTDEEVRTGLRSKSLKALGLGSGVDGTQAAPQDDAAAAGGTGWTFAPATIESMMDALSAAVEMYVSDRGAWTALQQRGMAKDWSWGRAAGQYRRLVSQIMQGSGSEGAKTMTKAGEKVAA